MIFYFNFYLNDLNKFFVDLNKYFNHDHINQFDPEILSMTCIKNNKLIGLVGY